MIIIHDNDNDTIYNPIMYIILHIVTVYKFHHDLGLYIVLLRSAATTAITLPLYESIFYIYGHQQSRYCCMCPRFYKMSEA